METKIIIVICLAIILLSTTLINPVTAKSVEGYVRKRGNDETNSLSTILKEIVKWKELTCNSNFNLSKFSSILWFIMGFLLAFLWWEVLPKLLHHDQEKSSDSSNTQICGI